MEIRRKIGALYYILPSHTLLSHLLLVPYNLTVKEIPSISISYMYRFHMYICIYMIEEYTMKNEEYVQFSGAFVTFIALSEN